MKRHPAFQDLSRDHFAALLGAQGVTRSIEGHEHAKPFPVASANLLTLWNDELEWHFDEEDVNLVPVLEAHDARDLIAHLAADHVRLRAQFAALASEAPVAAWQAAADGLRKHIRWEEEALFPWMQDNLSDLEMESLLQYSIEFRTKNRGPDSVQKPRT